MVALMVPVIMFVIILKTALIMGRVIETVPVLIINHVQIGRSIN